MKRPEKKDYQTKTFHHFDMEKYAEDLNKYIDFLVYEFSLQNVSEKVEYRCVNCGNFTSENKWIGNCSVECMKEWLEQANNIKTT